MTDQASTPFDIAWDEAAGVLRLRLAGFWTRATLVAFGAKLAIEVGRARLKRRDFAMLSDARAFPVQSTEVADGFEKLTRGGARMMTGRTAIVVGGALAKMQAERSMAGPTLQIFTDMAAAEAWLAEGR